MKSSKFRNKKRGHYRKTAKTYRKKSLKKRTRKMRGGRTDELFYAIDKSDVNLVRRVLDGETILYTNKAKDMITGKKETTDINARNNDHYTPLTYAINKKCNNNSNTQSNTVINNKCNYDIIKLLIQRGADVNFESEDVFGDERIERRIIPGMNPDSYRGSTPLVDAIHNNLDREIIELLINNGADVNKMNFNRQTPLGEALYSRSKFEIYELLINKGARVSESMLCSALSDKKDEKIIKLLIEKGSDVDYLQPFWDRNGPLFTPLLYAIYNEYSFDIIKLLVDNGATILVKNKDGYNGNEKNGEKSEISYFVKDENGNNTILIREVIPDKRNDGDVSPFSLIFPLRQKNKKEYDKRLSLFIDALNLDVDKYNVIIISYFLNNLYDRSYDDNNKLVDKEAIIMHEDYTDSLLNSALINFKTNMYNKRRLKKTRGGKEIYVDEIENNTIFRNIDMLNDVIKLFIQKSKDINKKNKNGETPLSLAIQYGYDDSVINEIIKKGATIDDVEKKYNNGNTLLCMAVKYNNIDVIKRLIIDNKANVNVVNEDGNTPLLLAIQNDVNPSIIELLIKNGANVSAINKKKETPILLAINNYKNNFLHTTDTRMEERKNVVKLLIQNDPTFNISNISKNDVHPESDLGKMISRVYNEKKNKLSGNKVTNYKIGDILKFNGGISGIYDYTGRILVGEITYIQILDNGKRHFNMRLNIGQNMDNKDIFAGKSNINMGLSEENIIELQGSI